MLKDLSILVLAQLNIRAREAIGTCSVADHQKPKNPILAKPLCFHLLLLSNLFATITLIINQSQFY
jgi:hypothetical protein